MIRKAALFPFGIIICLLVVELALEFRQLRRGVFLLALLAPHRKRRLEPLSLLASVSTGIDCYSHRLSPLLGRRKVGRLANPLRSSQEMCTSDRLETAEVEGIA